MAKNLTARDRAYREAAARWMEYVRDQTGRTLTDFGGNTATRLVKDPYKGSAPMLRTLQNISADTGVPLDPEIMTLADLPKPEIPFDENRLRQAILIAVVGLEMDDPEDTAREMTTIVIQAYRQLGERENDLGRVLSDVEAIAGSNRLLPHREPPQHSARRLSRRPR